MDGGGGQHCADGDQQTLKGQPEESAFSHSELMVYTSLQADKVTKGEKLGAGSIIRLMSQGLPVPELRGPLGSSSSGSPGYQF